MVRAFLYFSYFSNIFELHVKLRCNCNDKPCLSVMRTCVCARCKQVGSAAKQTERVFMLHNNNIYMLHDHVVSILAFFSLLFFSPASFGAAFTPANDHFSLLVI